MEKDEIDRKSKFYIQTPSLGGQFGWESNPSRVWVH